MSRLKYRIGDLFRLSGKWDSGNRMLGSLPIMILLSAYYVPTTDSNLLAHRFSWTMAKSHFPFSCTVSGRLSVSFWKYLPTRYVRLWAQISPWRSLAASSAWLRAMYLVSWEKGVSVIKVLGRHDFIIKPKCLCFSRVLPPVAQWLLVTVV